MIKLKKLIIDNNNLIKTIKNYFISEFDFESWEDFVNNQKNGDCQLIVSYITHQFSQCKKIFGEIERDNSYIDEYGE